MIRMARRDRPRLHERYRTGAIMRYHIADASRRWPGRTLLMGAALAVLACDNERTPSITEPLVGPTVAVTVLPRVLNLVAGDAGSLSARGADARNRITAATFTWSVTDPSVATVGRLDGYVVAIA